MRRSPLPAAAGACSSSDPSRPSTAARTARGLRGSASRSAAVGTTPEGELGEERGEPIGQATNNVAEYRALLLAVERARELGATEVELIGDSELIVRQVRGEYRVKDPGLKPLHAAAVEAL